MKKISIVASALLFTATAFAQTWSVDKAHSRIGYGITHLGIAESEGNFKSFDAKITATKADFSDLSITVSADVNTISTDNEMRDKHLKSPDFFDAEKFGTLSFKSTAVKKVSAKVFKVTGDLTLHGVTKPVTVELTVNGTVTNPMSKKEEVGVKVTGTFKRSDFGIGASMPPAMLSDEVVLKANGEFIKD